MSSLFTGDVKSNIRLNEESITDEQVIEAAKYVNADGFISQLEGGYDHRVIEGARPFRRAAAGCCPLPGRWPSPLCPHPGRSHRQHRYRDRGPHPGCSGQKLMEGRTTIIVAHRLSTIQNCDKIIVMHKGRSGKRGRTRSFWPGGMYYKL